MSPLVWQSPASWPGHVTRLLGSFPNPEQGAFLQGPAALRPLYLVTFPAAELWAGAEVPGPGHDVTAEVFQPWLEEATEASPREGNIVRDLHMAGERQNHGDHVHDQRLEVEEEAVRREEVVEDRVGQRCAETLRRLLESRGVVDAAALARVVESLDSQGREVGGQRMVARAWLDPHFRSVTSSTELQR